MKTNVAVFWFLLILGSLSFGISLSDALTKAKIVNSNYMLSGYALEKTNLEYEKAIIESTNKEEELNAEVSRLNGLSDYLRNYVRSYYTEVVIGYFDMRIAQIAAEAAQLSYLNTKIDYERKTDLLQKSILSEPEWKESEISLNDALDAYEKADIDYKNKVFEYQRCTGLDEKTVVDIPTPDYTRFTVSEEAWQKTHRDLQNATLSYEIAKYAVDTLPSATSAYNRKIKTHNLKQKEVALKIAQISALDEKKKTEQTLFYKKRQIENAQKRVAIAQAEMQDIQNRFGKGLVTEVQIHTQQISLSNAQRTLLTNQSEYWSAFFDYIIAIALPLDDVLKSLGEK
ncbi:MAG TPA: hypothetical protein PLF98_02850 [Thermotogota bacterium]|nr:hypothetical protein [Thermotogota bacterium]